jgi:hypothetical protein
MIALMRKIASAESAEITDDALALITRAAEGLSAGCDVTIGSGDQPWSG